MIDEKAVLAQAWIWTAVALIDGVIVWSSATRWNGICLGSAGFVAGYFWSGYLLMRDQNKQGAGVPKAVAK